MRHGANSPTTRKRNGVACLAAYPHGVTARGNVAITRGKIMQPAKAWVKRKQQLLRRTPSKDMGAAICECANVAASRTPWSPCGANTCTGAVGRHRNSSRTVTRAGRITASAARCKLRPASPSGSCSRAGTHAQTGSPLKQRGTHTACMPQ